MNNSTEELKKSTDLIERQVVLALPRNRIRNMRGEIVEETINVAYVEQLPSVQPDMERINSLLNTCTRTCTLSYLLKNELAKVLLAQPEPIWGLPVSADRPLADREIIPRLRQIQAGIPGRDYAIDRAIEIIEAVAERRTDG